MIMPYRVVCVATWVVVFVVGHLINKKFIC